MPLVINIGVTPGDGTGTPLYQGMQLIMNEVAFLEAAVSAAASTANTALSLVSNPSAGSATLAPRAKLKRALTTNLQVVEDAFMALASSSNESITWQNAAFFPLGGIVSAVIKTTLSFDDTQMASIWAAAFALTE